MPLSILFTPTRADFDILSIPSTGSQDSTLCEVVDRVRLRVRGSEHIVNLGARIEALVLSPCRYLDFSALCWGGVGRVQYVDVTGMS